MSHRISEPTGDDLVPVAAEPMPTSQDAVSEFPHGGRTQVRTCPVTAIYRLSEQGRKASLLEGGDGRAVQEIKVAVPTNRFHLVSVDAEGHAQLRLFPRYYLNDSQSVIRDNEPPIFDTVPSVDDLLKEAARNHQLERAYRVERAEHHRKRREGQLDAHHRLAERFLADPSLRALQHPKPTPRKCYFTVGPGQTVVYDAKRDVGVAREVPPEAYRRFLGDFRQRSERTAEIKAAQLALHEERERFVADWVASHGTSEQRDRYAQGMLPLKEVLEALGDVTFAAAGDRPRYVRDTVAQLQTHLRCLPQYANAVVSRGDFLVTTAYAEHATEAQSGFVRELQTLFPDATIKLLFQRMSWKQDPSAPALNAFFALVTQQVGPFLLRREYVAPDS